MGRPLRIDCPGGWYHVINRGAARQRIFFEDCDRVEFQQLLGLAHERFGVRVHTYCLMTNHFHLLLDCPDGNLSKFMHLIGSVYVRHLNERQGRDGPLFRDRFYAKEVTSEAYLTRLVRYIHRNPLAFCTVDQLRAYPWSSFPVYLGTEGRPPWLFTDNVLGMFPGVNDLDRYITTDESAVGPATAPLDGTGWLAAISLMVDETLDGAARTSVDKTVAALLLDRLTGNERAAVAEQLGFPSPDAERAARSRARRRAATDPELLGVVERVLALAANERCLAPFVRGGGQSTAA